MNTKINTVIEALEQAQKCVYSRSGFLAQEYINDALALLRSLPEQGEGPVAWMSDDGGVISAKVHEGMEHAESPLLVHYSTPPYAHPPQVGLASIEQSPAPVSQRVLTKGGEEDPWVVARLAAWKKKPPTNDDPEDDDATKNARADLREEMDACGWDIYGGSDYHIIVGMNYAWEEGFLEARAQSYRNPTPPSQELIRAVDAAAPSTPTVEEIMEVVMSRVRANADGVGYVTFYINDEGKVFENKLRSHLSKLHQQKGLAPSSKGE